jgi:hypothetical protein
MGMTHNTCTHLKQHTAAAMGRQSCLACMFSRSQCIIGAHTPIAKEHRKSVKLCVRLFRSCEQLWSHCADEQDAVRPAILTADGVTGKLQEALAAGNAADALFLLEYELTLYMTAMRQISLGSNKVCVEQACEEDLFVGVPTDKGAHGFSLLCYNVIIDFTADSMIGRHRRHKEMHHAKDLAHKPMLTAAGPKSSGHLCVVIRINHESLLFGVCAFLDFLARVFPSLARAELCCIFSVHASLNGQKMGAPQCVEI